MRLRLLAAVAVLSLCAGPAGAETLGELYERMTEGADYLSALGAG